ncbi:MAG: ribosomal protein S18-alanine N-acetyltransferase [Caldimonas sp.]
MSALWRDSEPGAEDGARVLAPMTRADIDAVIAIETAVYPFPWTRGNFIDSLAAGYSTQLLLIGAALSGYFVALAGADEMHLLNITVVPAEQRRGHARFMLDALVAECRRARAGTLWLEVRESNAGARAAYERLGFRERGIRSGYYPAPHGQRESAVVMNLSIEARDALD